MFAFLAGGKKDEKLIIPLNDSLSATLSMDEVNGFFKMYIVHFMIQYLYFLYVNHSIFIL